MARKVPDPGDIPLYGEEVLKMEEIKKMVSNYSRKIKRRQCASQKCNHGKPCNKTYSLDQIIPTQEEKEAYAKHYKEMRQNNSELRKGQIKANREWKGKNRKKYLKKHRESERIARKEGRRERE